MIGFGFHNHLPGKKTLWVFTCHDRVTLVLRSDSNNHPIKPLLYELPIKIMPNQTETGLAVDESGVVVSKNATSKSQPFIGQWNQLISTTNWDKGEIICQWRESMQANNVAVSDFSDEAWSQLVGGVTPQHVGRLRRTFERFGHVHKEYEGVYWSHFYAALDWDDAEMWLEGAVQNRWSISGMRQQRWETLGKIGDPPGAGEVVVSEFAEETQSLALSENTRNSDRDYIEGPVHEGPDWGDDEQSSGKGKGSTAELDGEMVASAKPHAIRPFESFTDLPDDVMEAASAFKVAIIRHKSDGWNEVSKEDMIGLLDALKQLASIAPE